MAHRPTVVHLFSGDLWAGAEVVIYNLLSHLHRAGDTSIMALSMTDGVLSRRLQQAGINVHILPEDSLSFAQIFRNARRLLLDAKVDVLHSHRYKENLLATLLRTTHGFIPTITTVHGLAEFIARPTLRTRLVSSLNTFALRHTFTRVVAVSHDIAKTLIADRGRHGNHVTVIHNGIHLPESASARLAVLAPGLKGRAPHVGTVGRLVPVKDYDLFLAVAQEIRRNLPSARFSIVGEGPLRVALECKATALGLTGCLEFLIPREDLMPYYDSLDLYLNTSRHEGIPLTVLEAMARGVPVVCPHVGGFPEILPSAYTASLISDRSPWPYAVRCLQLLTDDSLRFRLAQESVSHVHAHFSANRMASEYATLYRTVARERPCATCP